MNKNIISFLFFLGMTFSIMPSQENLMNLLDAVRDSDESRVESMLDSMDTELTEKSARIVMYAVDRCSTEESAELREIICLFGNHFEEMNFSNDLYSRYIRELDSLDEEQYPTSFFGDNISYDAAEAAIRFDIIPSFVLIDEGAVEDQLEDALVRKIAQSLKIDAERQTEKQIEKFVMRPIERGAAAEEIDLMQGSQMPIVRPIVRRKAAAAEEQEPPQSYQMPKEKKKKKKKKSKPQKVMTFLDSIAEDDESE